MGDEPAVEVVDVDVEGVGAELGQRRRVAVVALGRAGAERVEGEQRPPAVEVILVAQEVRLVGHIDAGALAETQATVDGVEQRAAVGCVQELEAVALNPAQRLIKTHQRLLDLLDIAVDLAQPQVDLVEAVLHGGVDRVQLLIDTIEAVMHLGA